MPLCETMKTTIHVVLGPPKSGLSVVGACLNILGLMTQSYQSDAAAINTLLLQDMGLSPLSCAPLPAGWTRTETARKAKQKIENLLKATKSSGRHSCIVDYSLCRTLPLWQEVMEESALAFKYIFMLRHPWETAVALSKDQGINRTKAHILWYAHIRYALRAIGGQDCALITYDQLMADPVSVFASDPFLSTLTDNTRSMNSLRNLLDFVQPNLKHHHAADLSEADKQEYKAYANLYDLLRFSQSGKVNRQAPQIPLLCEPLEISRDPVFSTWEKNLDAPDLLDSFLSVMGQQEKRYSDGLGAKAPFAHTSRSLQCCIIFPSVAEGGEVTENISLIPDQWQKIAVPLPQVPLPEDGFVIIKPLKTHGTVSIASIALVNKATGQELWAANQTKGFENLHIDGSAVRLPRKDCLELLITGDVPRITAPLPPEASGRPVDLVVWIRVSRDQTIVGKYLKVAMAAEAGKSITVSSPHISFDLPCTLPTGQSVNLGLAPMGDLPKDAALHCEAGFAFFSLPEGAYQYLRFPMEQNFEAPPGKNVFSLLPDTQYRLSGNSAILGGSVQLWLIEYSAEERLTHTQIPLPTGPLELTWSTHSKHAGMTLALRLAGSGGLMLSDLAISRATEPPPLPPAEDISPLRRDRIAQAYLGLWGGTAVQEKSRRRLHWMASQVSGKRVLDIGCSEGILPILLGREGYEVTGVDVNREALAYAAALLKEENDFVRTRVSFVHGDMTNLHLEAAPFDTVILGEVLEHLVKPERMVQNAFRHLKPEGLLVLTTPYGYFPDEDHRQMFTLQQLIALLSPCFAPVHLSIEDGYIRFMGVKSVTAALDDWAAFTEKRLLGIAEQAILAQQEFLYNQIAHWQGREKSAREALSGLPREVSMLRSASTRLLQYILGTADDEDK